MKYDAEEQHQGMLRVYRSLRILAVDIGKTAVIGDYTARDTAKFFFIECYHLKDWLKKDSRIKKPRDVERFVAKSQSLSLAADLCNSLKHAGLANASRSGVYLNRINMAYRLIVPASGESGTVEMIRNPSEGDSIAVGRSDKISRPVASAQVMITIGTEKYEALKLATECVNEWNAFLQDQGIKFLTA